MRPPNGSLPNISAAASKTKTEATFEQEGSDSDPSCSKVSRELGGEALLQRGQLVPEGSGEVIAELRKVGFDVGNLARPLVRIDSEQFGHVLGRHVEAFHGDAVWPRHVSDRRLDGVAAAIDALEDPFEHSAVLAE